MGAQEVYVICGTILPGRQMLGEVRVVCEDPSDVIVEWSIGDCVAARSKHTDWQ